MDVLPPGFSYYLHKEDFYSLFQGICESVLISCCFAIVKKEGAF